MTPAPSLDGRGPSPASPGGAPLAPRPRRVDYLLAVAVGSSHAMATRDAVLDTELIAAIKRAVPVPLVLHGSSGVPDDGMVAAINAGMTKINVSTHLNVVFTSRIRDILLHDPGLVDPRKYVGPATGIVRDEVRRLMELYAPWCAVA